MEAWIAAAVLAGVFAALLLTRRPPELVFLAGAAALALAGVVPVEAAVAGFASPGLVTVALLYVVAAGVQETGALGWTVQSLIGNPRSARHALVRLCPPLAFVSAFVNNTPLMAMLIPLVKDGCRRAGIAPSRVLLPLNHATLLGGTCTLIGTSTNLVVAGLVAAQGGPEVAFFAMAPIGVPVALAGMAYLVLVAPRLLPDRTPVAGDAQAMREYATEVEVDDGGPLVGRSVAQAGLRQLAGLFLVEIDRRGRVLAAVGPDEVLEAGDRLVFVGALDTVVELHRIRGLTPAAGQVFRLDGPRSARMLVEAVIGPRCPIVGQSVREGRFRSRYGAAIVAIARSGERLRSKIGDVVLRPGDTLLLEARPEFLERYRNARDFLLVSPLDGARPVEHRRAPVALAILAGVVITAGSGLTSMLHAALGGAAAVILTRCLTFEGARRALDGGVLITIGAAIAIGTAVEHSGLAHTITARVLEGLGGGALGAVAGIYLTTVLLTQMISNNAAAALMVPFALSTAAGTGMDPLVPVLAVMMAASASYATPVGYQTNLMVMGPGGYRTADYLRMGLPLHVLTGALTLALLALMARA